MSAVVAGTLIYAADAALFVLDGAARRAMLVDAVGGAEVLGVLDPALADRTAILMRLAMLACWVVLALYAWLLRDTFGRRA